MTSQSQRGSSSVCSRCGRAPAHDREHCPAKDATCRKCAKRGHYQAMCRSSVKVGGVQAHTYPTGGSQDVFLGAVGAQGTNHRNPWAVTLQLNDTEMEFHIDTDAEVTVIPEHACGQIRCPPLTSPQRTLRGPDTHILPVKGLFTGKLKNEEREVEEEIYVVRRLNKPLLGRPAIQQLGVVVRVETIEGKAWDPKQ